MSENDSLPRHWKQVPEAVVDTMFHSANKPFRSYQNTATNAVLVMRVEKPDQFSAPASAEEIEAILDGNRVHGSASPDGSVPEQYHLELGVITDPDGYVKLDDLNTDGHDQQTAVQEAHNVMRYYHSKVVHYSFDVGAE